MSNDENTQVADSSPAIRTIFPQEIAEVDALDTASPGGQLAPDDVLECP